MSSNPSSSSLSSVVSNLVRAQMGTTLAPTVTDEDLDRHVAELILKEAKKKAERYGQQGIRALISSNLGESNAPRPNKRFLTSIIKSTDEHNKTVLRAQALAAEEVKRERLEQEKQERRRRAQEAVEAEKQRRSSGRNSRHHSSSVSHSHSRSRLGPSSRKRDSDEGWDRWDGRTAERKRKARDWATWQGEDSDEEVGKKRRKRRSRSRSQSRDRDGRAQSPRHTRQTDEARHRRHDRERSRSPRDVHATDRGRRREDAPTGHRSHSPSSSHTAGSESPKRRRPKYALDDLVDDEPRPHRSSKGKERARNDHRTRDRNPKHKSGTGTSTRRRSRSPTPTYPGSNSKPRSISISSVPSSRSSTPGPQPQAQLPSKMDKYFEESYDPRLDVAPLTAPSVPKEGLINDAEYDGWDHMLELIRLRQQDKEDKKALERLGLSSKEIKERKKSTTVATGSSAEAAARWGGEGANVMDIAYSKRGAVREWDLGKAGF